jgi:hypothetical protein
MFDHLKSDLKIVSPDGTVRSIERGLVDSKQIIIENTKAIILVGDEIRRTLPSGMEETFEVLDPVCFPGPTLPHYEVRYKRKGMFPSGTGGNYKIHVSGPNARVNVNSYDHSHNVVIAENAFVELRNKINSDVLNAEDRDRLLTAIEDMQKHRNDRAGFSMAYQKFIASAADHMTLIAPFLPAITQFLG